MNWVERLAGRLGALPAWQSALLGLGVGALGALGQSPFVVNGDPVGFWPATALMVFGFVIALDTAPPGGGARPWLGAGAWRGFWIGFGYFLAGMWWVGAAFVSRGPAFAPFAPLGAVALAGGLALFWAVAGALAGRFWVADHRRIAIFALALCGCEFARGFLFSGLPWNLIGYVWPAGGAMSQTAAHIGIWGLSAITVYAFAAPAAVFSRQGTMVTKALPVMIGFALLSVSYAGGLGRLSNAGSAVVPGVSLRMVQLDLTLREKYATPPGQLLDRYITASQSDGFDAVTHVIWPENVVPMWMMEESRALEWLDRSFRDDQLLLTGLIRRETREDFRSSMPLALGADPGLSSAQGRADRGGRTAPAGEPDFDRNYNAFVAFSFSRGVTFPEAIYDKTRLAPFGEYLPLQGLMGRLGFGDGLSRAGLFHPGSGATSVSIAGTPVFTPMICYEAVFPGFTPRGNRRPAWIVNVSNDAWYGRTPGPWQFLNLTRYRAIEEGVPLVRSVIGGVSGVVDPYGRMPADWRARFGGYAVVDAPLPVALRPTLYAVWGNAPLALLFYLGFVLSRWRPGSGAAAR